MTEEILENPVTGETMRVIESTPKTFTIEYALRPHGEIALEHFHPGIEQEISVRSGEMHVTVDGEHKFTCLVTNALLRNQYGAVDSGHFDDLPIGPA